MLEVKIIEDDKKGNTIYNNQVYSMLEAHLNHLRKEAVEKKRIIYIDDSETNQFRGDLASILIRRKIPMEHHWIVARINGWDTCTDWNGLVTAIWCPNLEIIEDYIKSFNNKMKK